jgi:hypothetical protein
MLMSIPFMLFLYGLLGLAFFMLINAVEPMDKSGAAYYLFMFVSCIPLNIYGTGGLDILLVLPPLAISVLYYKMPAMG